MKQFRYLGLMLAFSFISCAVTPTNPVVRAVSDHRRIPLDYERAFNAGHWQFTIHQHSVHHVGVALYLDGKELIATGLSEQSASSSKPLIFDVALSPLIGSLLVNDKWQLWISLRDHSSFSYVIPRPRGTDSMAWEQEPAPPEIAPNRFVLGRFLESDTNPRHSRQLTLQIRVNED